ncbi:MAG TPA: SDR family oxidoreductase [Candidatus Sulfomarinibacteraceae bacterium]|nr:SDR family oxidoreductase [Candidatus Sulfomarinibacteraceae bacterium]
MKVTIFGATGRTGRYLVEQAVAAGYHVTAFTRSPHKLDAHRDRIEIVEGNVQDAAAVEEAVAGADAVLSVLGPTENAPDYQIARGTGHIVEAMAKHGVQRLIISAGAGVSDPNDEPTLLNKLINVLLSLFSRHVYEDMKRTVALVRASDVAWTIVRVPRLVDGDASGDIKAGHVGKGMGMSLRRGDLAAFMLQQLQSDAYLRRAPAISN